jgi:ABC-type nitrate/sulfonate/bicarbonate transport system ATPase subunit
MVSGGQVDTLAYETDGPAGSRIELRQIEKTYGLRSGERVCALRDVNFNVTPSTFVSVVGASGCGKSTLLRIVGGLSRQTTARSPGRGVTSASSSRLRSCCRGARC